MPIDPRVFQTGGALQGAVAASLLRQREADAELRPGERVGIYRVLRELGRGGMAIVYLAERDDGEYQQQVALKWMHAAQADDAGEALFRRERQALADLSHPHIARLLDGGRSAGGRPWFAMEYIEGEPLDRHCMDSALPLARRLALFRHVCEAVAFAHARGVIHRDIKPSNVLVDRNGNAKLLDFGIAQWLGQHDALATRACTPGFASPEQWRGESVTVASDVYQLGRLLVAILCSDEAENQQLATREATRVTQLPAAGSASATPANPAATPLPPGLPIDLAAILTRATDADPARRYATVDALAADLSAFLERRPVRARPRHAAYLATRYVQRHPVATTAALATLLAAGLATLLVTSRLRLERDAAQHQARIANTTLQFMRDDLLAAADPGAAPGEELTVRAALDLASASAAGRFADLPLEHSAIRRTLSDLYFRLGRYQESEREARQSRQLAEAAPAPQALRDAADWVLADTLVMRDRLDEAEALLKQLLANAQPVPERSRDTLALQSALGGIYHRRGEYEHALTTQQAVLDAATASLGAEDALSLDVAEQVAINLQMLGRHAEALPLFERVYAQRLARNGKSHPATLLASHELGVLKRHQGEPEAALAWLEPTLAARRKVLGPEHPETLSSANETATVLQELKRYAEAEPLFRATLDARLRRLGEEHLYTRNSMNNLGLLYSVWGKLEDAAPLYERALAIETRLIGLSHPDTISLMHNLAGLYRKQGRLSEALDQHRRALAAAEASPDLGPDAWQTALFRAGYALSLQADKDYSEADAQFERAISTLDATLGAEHPRSQRARQMRAALRAERDAAR
jgi:tetratricopeptide (TPR) repeat protein/predicted Ser/Thr protein kinase